VRRNCDTKVSVNTSPLKASKPKTLLASIEDVAATQITAKHLEEEVASLNRMIGHLKAEKEKDAVAKRALFSQKTREIAHLKTQLEEV
jgi:hypothetical protein